MNKKVHIAIEILLVAIIVILLYMYSNKDSIYYDQLQKYKMEVGDKINNDDVSKSTMIEFEDAQSRIRELVDSLRDMKIDSEKFEQSVTELDNLLKGLLRSGSELEARYKNNTFADNGKKVSFICSLIKDIVEKDKFEIENLTKIKLEKERLENENKNLCLKVEKLNLQVLDLSGNADAIQKMQANLEFKNDSIQYLKKQVVEISKDLALKNGELERANKTIDDTKKENIRLTKLLDQRDRKTPVAIELDIKSFKTKVGKDFDIPIKFLENSDFPKGSKVSLYIQVGKIEGTTRKEIYYLNTNANYNGMFYYNGSLIDYEWNGKEFKSSIPCSTTEQGKIKLTKENIICNYWIFVDGKLIDQKTDVTN